MSNGSPKKSSLKTKGQAVQSGLDVLVRDKFTALRGARIGILANQSAVDSTLTHIVDRLTSATSVNVVRLFAPEHGFRGVRQDMERVGETRDAISGLPVTSLYGGSIESLTPSVESMSDLDIVVADLPDIGSRYYTFAQTLAYVMEVAGRCGVKVVVLDRPNPLGGVMIEGALLRRKCRSFCGLAPVANRHGLTLGELALLMRAGFGKGEDALEPIQCDTEVVQVEGWKRERYYDQTGLPWVIPSPNMPTLDTAIVYPGMCLFEATNISEGRGTTRPFELLGAPFVDGTRWAEQVFQEGLSLEGALLRPTSFVPKFQKWRDELCYGIQIHVTDRERFQPVRWGLALLSAAHRLYSKEFSWRSDVYEFENAIPAIDLLFGSSMFREALNLFERLDGLDREMTLFENTYRKQAAAYFLY